VFLLKAKMKIKVRGTTFVFGAQRVANGNLEKKEAEDRSSGCYSEAGEQSAYFNVGGRRRPLFGRSRARGCAAASL
jgi:hypothetical protein